MQTTDWSVKAVSVPGESRVTEMYDAPYLADAYAVRLPDGAIADPESLARFLLTHQPSWVARLMSVRDALVASFGIKTATQLRKSPTDAGEERIDIFRVYERRPHEIILGADDKHLDFRLSVMREMRPLAIGAAPYLVVSTVVNCHNRLGRTYINLIAPFHRLVVESWLRRAAHLGWPTASKS
ncbi:MAG: DUF2867 domain-containing protein [Paraburkholderia sp.]|jgi:hypothetical protein|uniref:DUF2867 domain-containing protein n=1 Tax=Burkholderiaceae TaxID=119060 RepID=UPI0010F9EA15|nr:DUF2867 domain-containing protein [Burkholderia sp. 4M9327F10]